MVKKLTRPVKCLKQLAFMTKHVDRMLEWLCIWYDGNKTLECLRFSASLKLFKIILVLSQKTKPTAEGRQFIKPHHPKTTIKSIWLRPLKQRKKVRLSSLNRHKEKAIRSIVHLDMTYDMISMAANWETSPPPKCNTKDEPFVWATSFHHLPTPREKKKNLHTKAVITFQRSTRIGQKLTNCKHLALSKTQKQAKGASRPYKHCALCGCETVQ